jgi:hypothetical protein
VSRAFFTPLAVLVLLILAALLGFAQAQPQVVIDYTEVVRKLEGGQTTSTEVLKQLAESTQPDPTLSELLTNASLTSEKRGELVEESIAHARLGAMLQGGASRLSQSPQQLAEAVKSSGPYMQASDRTTSNWASNTLGALGRLIERLLERPTRTSDRNFSAPAQMNWLLPVAYVFLGMIVVGSLTFLGIYLYKRIRAKRRTALIDEFEEERSLDEWLELARGFEAKGEYRKAVRAAYIACLLKFDELEVARFMKGQTNWEHLVRIERSPKLAPEVDFRAATKLFDLVWYGHRHAGKEEVAQMFEAYERIVDTHKVEVPKEPVPA